MRRVVIVLGLLLGGHLLAQESASFRLNEHTFNAGGTPDQGVLLTSASFQVSLCAVGESVRDPELTSASFGMKVGFVPTYAPPGEVANLRFTDSTTVAWDGERSVGVYHLYQGTVSDPFDPSYGTCNQPDIPIETTSVTSTPTTGQVLFLLVTAKNRLDEEGTKGKDSDDAERANPLACP